MAANENGRGRTASAPQHIPVKGWRDIAMRVLGSFNTDRVPFTAAGVTFFVLLALVPTLTAFVSIYGLFADRATVVDHVSLLSGVIPADGLQLISDQLERVAGEGNTALSWSLLISLAIALWSSSAGVKGMFQAMNIAYGEEERRNFLIFNGLALLFTLAFAVTAVLVVGIVVVIPSILSIFPLGGLSEWLIRIASFALLVAVVLIGLAMLYRFGPSRSQARWRWITPGAALAVLLTLVVSVLFSWYVANFGNYNATYGSLGALIGLLTWTWISTIIVILGAEVDSEIEHQTARDTTTGPEVPLGERGAYVADTVGKRAGS
ncbi:ribonuclease [Devosia pacifica]|uniref:Ribonuclease n=1 Tax=Devosia pacifica TaxID=1335967 RepID=A0A918VYX8_9HYPH|nr:YihY/virulence factor BrkB family protein [Devosia pacifica]GHA36016.1 ribonuclease [Devosia pacifica]